jgi:collagenase-like PrtC family protease
MQITDNRGGCINTCDHDIKWYTTLQMDKMCHLKKIKSLSKNWWCTPLLLNAYKKV